MGHTRKRCEHLCTLSMFSKKKKIALSNVINKSFEALLWENVIKTNHINLRKMFDDTIVSYTLSKNRKFLRVNLENVKVI